MTSSDTLTPEPASPGAVAAEGRDVHVDLVVVGAGPDVADDWIAERAARGAIVVTPDVPLAIRCVKKGPTSSRPRASRSAKASSGWHRPRAISSTSFARLARKPGARRRSARVTAPVSSAPWTTWSRACCAPASRRRRPEGSIP